MKDFHGLIRFLGKLVRFLHPVEFGGNLHRKRDQFLDHRRAQSKARHEGHHDSVIAESNNQNPFLRSDMLIDKAAEENPEECCKE